VKLSRGGAAAALRLQLALMNARDLVTHRIVSQTHRFPEFELAPIDVAGLDARDAALAVAIDHQVMRRWLTLVAVVQSRLTRRWDQVEPRLQGALLVGAAQLLFFDRLPDHAVINEAVEWAKRNVRPKAGAMVNAVLRQVAALRGELIGDNGHRVAALTADELPLEDGRVRKLAEKVFDSDPIRQLAQQTSHAEGLINRWVSAFGKDRTIELALHSLVHSPIILQGIDPKAIESFELEPHDEAGFFVFRSDRAALLKLLRAVPRALVQDPASAAPALATAGLKPRPKTIMQFAESRRVSVVEYNRLREFDNQADVLLFDVPCSNTGVLARRVEAKYRFDAESLKSLTDVQRQIIADSIPLLSPAGRLVYSTCSIEPAENERQTEWAGKWHRMAPLLQRSRLPAGLPGESPSSYHDGGYFSILERRG
jgi:16S rRNA (cytosine967-C5)-methyltransferase